jgi:tRNA-2-methylthio-N6-dimethylallyladenosine synthase
VVFGTHNIGSLPVLLERARVQEEAQIEILESLEVFPSTLPTKRESAYAAWVSISVGWNNTCTFCIVPALRGKEKDRRPGEILAEIEALVADGVSEVTLLGQHVNTYGVEFGDRLAFGKLLRACGAIEGLERVRFTSPHPSSFTDDVIEAMAQTPNVMPQLHMPLQSGSSRLLKEMRRSYRQEKYLGIIDRVRAAMPDAAITTDIIVGFPGETEEDFAQTLHVVREARFAAAFTFEYSKRPGTPAASLPDQVPPDVVRDRYERLVEVVNQIAWEENRRFEGRVVELMVSEGEGRKDAATHRLSGRARDNRLVHFTPVDEAGAAVEVRPGDMVEVLVTYGAPHHLVADGPVQSVRRTRSGDAWEARTSAPPSKGVSLGLPSVGVPPPLPDAPVCS